MGISSDHNQKKFFEESTSKNYLEKEVSIFSKKNENSQEFDSEDLPMTPQKEKEGLLGEYDYSNNNNSFSPENSESNDDLFGELKEQYDIDFNSKESMEDNDNFQSPLPVFPIYNPIDEFDSPKINSLPPFSPSNVIDSNQIIQKNQEIKPKIEKDQSPKENKPKKKRKRKRENNKDSKKKFNNHEIKKSKGIIRNSIRKFINNVLLRAYNHNYR